jgi:cytochrome c biogenesis protein CcmG/thiol:disulfide interchange protein DsbE
MQKISSVLLVLVSLLTVLDQYPAAAGAARPLAVNVPLATSTGRTMRVSDFRGKVVMLDFWATWCTGCKVEIPWFVEFEKKYKDRGLVTIGVAMDDEGWPIVTPYLAEHPIGYRIAVGDAKVAERYGVSSMPLTLLIDRHGRVADSHVGIVEKDAWEQKIRELLAER